MPADAAAVAPGSRSCSARNRPAAALRLAHAFFAIIEAGAQGLPFALV